MKSAVQLRRTDKSATVQLRQTHRLTGRISDIYIIDGISHQTDSNQLKQKIKSHRATGSPILSQFQSVHNFLQLEKSEAGVEERSVATSATTVRAKNTKRDCNWPTVDKEKGVQWNQPNKTRRASISSYPLSTVSLVQGI